jgi:hypothetical protein
MREAHKVRVRAKVCLKSAFVSTFVGNNSYIRACVCVCVYVCVCVRVCVCST